MEIKDIIAMATLIVAVITLLVAMYIPRKVMVDQQFMALTTQYRSPEMGFAIYCLLHFYECDCQNNPDNIRTRYIERFNREIRERMANVETIDPSRTLQYQRRLVAYFYWDLARLYFESWFPWLGKRKLCQMLGANERRLISLVLQMSEANAECFANTENIGEPPDEDVPMNQSIKRLYDKTEDLV